MAIKAETIEVGDFVTIGDSKLTWEVIHIWPSARPSALCESGQSARRMAWFVDSLRLFKKGPQYVEG